MKLKPILILIVSILLASCVSLNNSYNKKPSQSFVIKNNKPDTYAFDLLLNHFSHDIDEIWGINEAVIASTTSFVKYTDQYKTRVRINFTTGQINFETVDSTISLTKFRDFIVNILLMNSEDITVKDVFSNAPIQTSIKNSLLLSQILYHGKILTTKSQVVNYANNLIKNIKTRKVDNKKIYYITVQLVANHFDVRAKKLLPIVRKFAHRYQLSESLILGIIDTESSFNPLAVSYANAIGLMQIVPSTAGIDTFKYLNKSGKPSRSYLFNSHNNIELGTTYIHLLNTRYFHNVRNPTSRLYLIIASYNSGAGATLRMFDRNITKAIQKINSYSDKQIYDILVYNHPSNQARDYVMKVTLKMKKYSGSFKL